MCAVDWEKKEGTTTSGGMYEVSALEIFEEPFNFFREPSYLGQVPPTGQCPNKRAHRRTKKHV